MDASWMSAGQGRRVQRVRAGRGDRGGLDHRALAAIGLCVALPVLIGVLLSTGPERAAEPVPPTAGHWVYVPGRGIVAHVDGAAKRVDATVTVGSAGTGSPVLADRHAAYLVDDDRVIQFGREGVTGDAPAAGVAEHPVTVEGGAAYLVYRTAGLIVRLGPEPVTVPAGGPLGAPVVTPEGQLWTYRVDSGELCRLTDQSTLDCPGRLPDSHTGALAMLAGSPGFVDITAGTWQPLGDRGTGKPVTLGGPLPANAAVGSAAVGERLAITDPAGRKLLLVATGGDVITVPLGAGRFGGPVSAGGAVALVNADTGAITSYDAAGQRRAELTVAGEVRLATGPDGRVYADSADGLRSVIMDHDGTLTEVRTTGDEPPSYRPPAPTTPAALPPATIAPPTTETVPPVPETVTVQVAPTTTAQPAATGAPDRPGAATTPPRAPATTTGPAPGPPPGVPAVDVLSAAASGPEQATIQIRVSSAGPAFCHVFFNSVERTATRCAGSMTVVANGLAPGTAYDVYVLGTNTNGTGIPGRRALLRT